MHSTPVPGTSTIYCMECRRIIMYIMHVTGMSYLPRTVYPTTVLILLLIKITVCVCVTEYDHSGVLCTVAKEYVLRVYVRGLQVLQYLNRW